MQHKYIAPYPFLEKSTHERLKKFYRSSKSVAVKKSKSLPKPPKTVESKVVVPTHAKSLTAELLAEPISPNEFSLEPTHILFPKSPRIINTEKVIEKNASKKRLDRIAEDNDDRQSMFTFFKWYEFSRQRLSRMSSANMALCTKDIERYIKEGKKPQASFA